MGTTTDGRPVVDFFGLVDSRGLPLEVVLVALEREGLVPDWVGFWERSRRVGWRPSGTRLRLETAIKDVYGEEYLERWKERMDLLGT